MANVAAFCLAMLLAAPFAIAGSRRHWRAPLLIELLIAGYAFYLWSIPIDPMDDAQMQQLWRVVVYGLGLIVAVGFLAGVVASKFSDLRRRETEGLE